MRIDLWIAAACLVLAVGCKKEAATPSTQTSGTNTTTTGTTGTAAAGGAAEDLSATEAGKMLAKLDADIAFRKKTVAEKQDWSHWAAMASAYMAKARLTGDLGFYLEAQKALKSAFEAAPETSGPFMTRAEYHFAVHQLDAIEEDLEAAEKAMLRQDTDEAAAAAMRGDVAFARGELDRARELYRQAFDEVQSHSTAARIANYRLKTGDFDGAIKMYETALDEAGTSKQTQAWTLLHIGIVHLERNDLEAAMTHFQEADELFDGWYLIEEHIAEVKLAQGKVDEAIELYESVVARVPNGEFMSALADAYEQKGNAEKAAQWRTKAAKAFERDISRLPSAATGHAIDFFLETDPERALELARHNFEMRPGHEARTQLATALALNGKQEEARKVLKPTAASDWKTVESQATVAALFQERPEVARNAAEFVEEFDPTLVEELRQKFNPPDDPDK